MSKYSPLRDHLKNLTAQGVKNWNATYAQLEEILAFPLPKSAYTYHAWWNNEDSARTTHVQCKSWIDAGWVIEDVNINDHKIVFRKAAA